MIDVLGIDGFMVVRMVVSYQLVARRNVYVLEYPI